MFYDNIRSCYTTEELTDEFINDIIADPNLKYIQISHAVPEEVFQRIDKILAKRSDITFRIYGLYGDEIIDLNILKQMPHLERLTLDAIVLSESDCLTNYLALCEIRHLKRLSLEIHNLKDYHFIIGLSKSLEELCLLVDSTNGSIQFNCSWLLRYSHLKIRRLTPYYKTTGFI